MDGVAVLRRALEMTQALAQCARNRSKIDSGSTVRHNAGKAMARRYA
jgi:hypothetical protein